MKKDQQPPNEQLRQTTVSGSTISERIICAAVWYKEIPIKKKYQHNQQIQLIAQQD